MAADTREPVGPDPPETSYPPNSNGIQSSRPSSLDQLSQPPDSTSPSSTERPYRGKIYETFTPPSSTASSLSSPSSVTSSATKTISFSPPENANVIPGGSTNTAGGRVKEATFWDGLKSIKAEDLRNLHKIPCVRDAFLLGIGSGFMFGGGRLVFGGTIHKSVSWAVGTFCLSSAGMWEFCQRRRALERQGMMRATEIIDRKRLEKERQTEKIRAERRRRREEEETAREQEQKQKEKDEKRKDEWKFW